MKVLFIQDNEKNIGPNSWVNTLLKIFPKIGVNSELVFINNLKLVKNINKIRTMDIIHFYLPSPQSLFYLRLAKLFHKKTVYTLHGYFDIEAKNKPLWKRIFWNFSNKAMLKQAEIVTVPSIKLKEHIKKNNLIDREIIVIPNGIPIKRNIKFLPPNKNKILFITNFDHFEKSRGIIQAVGAFNLIKKRMPKVTMEIAGGGNYLEYFKKIVSTKDLQFLGYCKNLNEKIKGADIIIYISFLDNFPMTILEVLNNGKYLIVNDVGGVKEILGRELKKLLVLPNEKDISERVLEYYNSNSSTKKKYFLRIRDRMKVFDLKKVANQFRRQYEN